MIKTLMRGSNPRPLPHIYEVVMKTRQFLVTIEIPRGATVEEMRTYIWDAIVTLKGGLSPDDPLFDIDRDSIKVQKIV